jgi:hypothetical protein
MPMNSIALGLEGEPLDISAGSVFTKRRLKKGDVVYVLSVDQGRVYLIGRMKVDRILQREEYRRSVPSP